jgi:hypothetical protein
MEVINFFIFFINFFIFCNGAAHQLELYVGSVPEERKKRRKEEKESWYMPVI